LTTFIIGHIAEIISQADGENAFATLDIFDLVSERHELYDMPKLYRQYNERRLLVVPINVRNHFCLYYSSELIIVAARAVFLQCTA
jgi:hypothetical protein